MKRILTYFMVLTGLWSQTAVQIMSPEPDEQVTGNNILIAASFYGLEGLNVDNIQLSIDEEDITDQAFVDPDMVSYLIPLKRRRRYLRHGALIHHSIRNIAVNFVSCKLHKTSPFANFLTSALLDKEFS